MRDMPIDEPTSPGGESVYFAVHCDRNEVHTLHLGALGRVTLSHHADPEAEMVLVLLSGERRMPQCVRWWRALTGNDRLRERVMMLAWRGIDPLRQIRVVEHADGTVMFRERPGRWPWLLD